MLYIAINTFSPNRGHVLCFSAATTINNISSDFRVGFGSFVDKRVSPFVSENVNFLQNPCFGEPDFPGGCVSTYSYRHHVSLTSNERLFNVSSSAL